MKRIQLAHGGSCEEDNVPSYPRKLWDTVILPKALGSIVSGHPEMIVREKKNWIESYVTYKRNWCD